MTSRTTQQRLYEGLLNRYGVEIADAFLEAVQDFKSRADLKALIAAIEAGKIEEAIAALNLDPAAYNDMLDAVARSYGAGGKLTADALPSVQNLLGARIEQRFNVRHPRAENWLRTQSSTQITRIDTDIQAAVRSALVAGMGRGENPRTTALDIVGRIDRATGKREGGILGLTVAQQGYVENARAELASSDPKALSAFLERSRRDKRFDPAIKRAIKDEAPLARDTASKALIAYERRLLKLRGDTIGRTEALASLNASGDEALRQLVDTGAVTSAQVRRVWRSAADSRVRDTHQALNGDSVGLDEPFKSPSGATLRFPGDPSAPAAEIVNCRCWMQPRIDFLANVR